MAKKQGDNKVALVIGASRGIGRQIAIDLAKNGYKLVLGGHSTSSSSSNSSTFPPDPNSQESTITTVAREINKGIASGYATAVTVDVRDFESVKKIFEKTIEVYGRLDVLVYNSGAIWWSSVAGTPYKRFKLLQSVNPDGCYAAVQCALPIFAAQAAAASKQGSSSTGGGGGGRIVIVCPPIYSRFFRGKTAYAMGKVGMSVLVKGLAMDFVREAKGSSGGELDMSITGIWPAASIQSAATKQFESTPEHLKDLRKATIFSDAVLGILDTPHRDVNGLLTLDEDFLREFKGVGDFGEYSLVPGAKVRRIMPKVLPDLTVEEQDDEGMRVDSSKRASKL